MKSATVLTALSHQLIKPEMFGLIAAMPVSILYALFNRGRDGLRLASALENFASFSGAVFAAPLFHMAIFPLLNNPIITAYVPAAWAATLLTVVLCSLAQTLLPPVQANQREPSRPVNSAAIARDITYAGAGCLFAQILLAKSYPYLADFASLGLGILSAMLGSVLSRSAPGVGTVIGPYVFLGIKNMMPYPAIPASLAAAAVCAPIHSLFQCIRNTRQIAQALGITPTPALQR